MESRLRIVKQGNQTIMEMPHARVSISMVDGKLELEVWPKTGMSAFVHLDERAVNTLIDLLIEVGNWSEPPDNVISLFDPRKKGISDA